MDKAWEQKKLEARKMPENGGRVPTVQELLGHKDLRIIMIYTHVLNRGPKDVRTPLA
jgi:site-specific recombinase XerD